MGWNHHRGGHSWKIDVSADRWRSKLWSVYRVECYSGVKKNAFESVLMMCMKLEPIIESEVSQRENHQYRILMQYIWNLEIW